MRRSYFLVVSLFLTCLNAHAQTSGIVGPDMFFAGHWLEIGQDRNGAFGAPVAPADYHAYCPGCFSPTIPPNALAEVYDYGHDGWSVGSPPFMGDYTAPGNPYEGWEIQSGATRSQQLADGDITGYVSGAVTGGNTSFANASGSLRGVWTGTFTATAGQLEIHQETRVDTEASWVVVTTKMYNRSATTIPSVFYLRSCDPDNEAMWSTSPYSHYTNNYIDYQNDIGHRVQVRATTSPADIYPLSLCTKDCRAVATIYVGWPMSFSLDLLSVWNQTAPSSDFAVSTTPVTADQGIGLVFNVGDICVNDSNFVSCAYTFNGMNGVDSAFPDPTIAVNGMPAHDPAYPSAVYDTFNTCGTGLNTFPVELLYATTGAWTWSTWTWSPGMGLAATTGASNTINASAVPSMSTYTIVGTPYAPCGGTGTTACGTRTIYLTLITCFSATADIPCVGAPLHLNAPGDSTGATYAWLGPNSWVATTATSQAFTIAPTSWPDTGIYHVIKSVAGAKDTAFVHVAFYPKPDVYASSNAPLCDSPIPDNALNLTASASGAAIVSYSWTGPAAFTSPIQGPTIPGFTAADSGWYTIVATSDNGCIDTAFTHVSVLPPPGPPLPAGDTVYCFGAPFVPPTAITAAGAILYWSPSITGAPVSTTSTPAVNTSLPGTYVFYCWQALGFCTSPADSFKVRVDDKVVIQVKDTLSTYGNPIQAYSDRDLHYWWTPDDGTLSNPNINNPIATPLSATRYAVIGMDQLGCADTQYVFVTAGDDIQEFIPTAFTPDGDGLNDYFRPVGPTLQRMIDFRIYNRWGEQAYYSKNYTDKGWDGTMNGVPQDAGVYFFSITIAGRSENTVYKGDVTLIR